MRAAGSWLILTVSSSGSSVWIVCAESFVSRLSLLHTKPSGSEAIDNEHQLLIRAQTVVSKKNLCHKILGIIFITWPSDCRLYCSADLTYAAAISLTAKQITTHPSPTVHVAENRWCHAYLLVQLLLGEGRKWIAFLVSADDYVPVCCAVNIKVKLFISL